MSLARGHVLIAAARFHEAHQELTTMAGRAAGFGVRRYEVPWPTVRLHRTAIGGNPARPTRVIKQYEHMAPEMPIARRVLFYAFGGACAATVGDQPVAAQWLDEARSLVRQTPELPRATIRRSNVCSP